MVTAILLAAGSGTRTHLNENKILLPLGGLPVFSGALAAFLPYADEIVLACRAEDEEKISPYLPENARCVRGGKDRAESVKRALAAARGEIVLIHDAARPFVTEDTVRRVLDSVRAYGSGVAAVPSPDTVAVAEDGYTVPPRDRCYLVQTPQGFLTEEIRRAYVAAERDGREFTDDSGVYAAYIKPPRLVEGSICNKKITYLDDFPAERVGFGVDTHAFAHQGEWEKGIARLNMNYLKLCGVSVPSDRALLAHSDGDVPVHALMDALLSAIGERDIGVQFPDDNREYENADSMALLASVMEKVSAAGYRVKNASVTVLAERPRLSPYIGEMRSKLAAALNIDAGAVGVAAGTNEKLGYVGEGRGITACAAVLLGKDAR